jgi:Fur family zinc uptake transcriptional regulator
MDDATVPAFAPATESLLDRAAVLCERRDGRLTALRRHVLGLVLEAAHPPGAYELLDALRRHHKGAAPPTVYRALDFLVAQGLIHKVERLSAFVGCVHGLDEHDDHVHAVQFLICNTCRAVIELNDREIGQALLRAASRHGFAVTSSVVEADGSCAACAAVEVK